MRDLTAAGTADRRTTFRGERVQDGISTAMRLSIGTPLALLSVVTTGIATGGVVGLNEPDIVVNTVRARGCGSRPGIEQPLSSNEQLDEAARRVSSGAALEAALSQSGYRASTATVIHIEAPSGQNAVEQFLKGRFCDTVTDPALEDIGSVSLGREIWIVLAAPLAVPDEEDRAAVARRVLELTNDARAQARRCGRQRFPAAGPLTTDPRLAQAAQLHAKDMAERDTLSHRGRDASSVGERVQRTGYTWRAVGENVAEGQPSAETVVRDWVASPEHCATLMNPDYTQMGVGYATSRDGAGPTYWAQVFAAPR